MILSIGEILADMIAEEGNAFSMFCGGAPFNVAVNAAKAGAKAAFVGKVGKDVAGDFLLRESARYGLSRCDVLRDEARNTTLAFVALKNGERSFSFFRRDTADDAFSADEINFGLYEDLNIVHLGALMLGSERGRALFTALVQKIKAAGKVFSFDVNFRSDLFADERQMIAAYRFAVERADVLKFSEEEILLYTGENTLDRAMGRVARKDKLLLVTLGAKGSRYRINGLQGTVAAQPVTPIDTTGAGDAFFGTVLARLDGADWREGDAAFFEAALAFANARGGEATQFKGAIKQC